MFKGALQFFLLSCRETLVALTPLLSEENYSKNYSSKFKIRQIFIIINIDPLKPLEHHIIIILRMFKGRPCNWAPIMPLSGRYQKKLFMKIWDKAKWFPGSCLNMQHGIIIHDKALKAMEVRIFWWLNPSFKF